MCFSYIYIQYTNKLCFFYYRKYNELYSLSIYIYIVHFNICTIYECVYKGISIYNMVIYIIYIIYLYRVE